MQSEQPSPEESLGGAHEHTTNAAYASVIAGDMPSSTSMQHADSTTNGGPQRLHNWKDDIVEHLARARRHFMSLTKVQIAYIPFCIFLVVGGAIGQFISMNMWVHTFPKALKVNVPFTILTLSCFTNLVIYAVGFLLWSVIRRPALKFLATKRANYLALAIGFTNALNGVLIVSASRKTPEILQAFLLATVIVWTFVFVKIGFSEQRSYANPLVIGSFVLSLAGLAVGSASHFGASGMTWTKVAWTVIYGISLVPAALNGVISAKYMRHFTDVETHVEEEAVEPDCGSPSRAPLRGAGNFDHNADTDGSRVGATGPMHPNYSYGSLSESLGGERTFETLGTDSGTAKGARLLVGGFYQTICLLAMLPVAVIPWFGSVSSFASLGSGLRAGYRCTLNMEAGCDGAGWYYLLFALAFAGNNVGSAILNYYSPALTSMVSMLVSPLAAILLMAVPSWNVEAVHYHVAESVIAVILLTIGAVAYAVWEESTGHSSPDPAGSPTVGGAHTPR